MNNTKTVAELRRTGYKVRVMQRRYTRTIHGNPGKMKSTLEIPGPERHPRGGEVKVEITTPEGKELSASVRCVKEDAYNRKTGLYLAIERALAAE